MSKKVKTDIEAFARIRVVGAGGSGGNAVNHMVNSKVQGVDFIAVNTDAQDLHHSKAKKKIHIGKNLTRGLGTGMNPELGKQAAQETKEEIQEALKGSDMVFITGGMGGGTGTGSAPVIAQIAREMGILTVGVVTRPFAFEGAQRGRLAEQGLAEMKKAVDALIVIPNDKLLAIVNRDTGIRNAFAMCDDILKQAVEGISDLITTPGIINVDFADVRTIMENAGSALMGVGVASGEKRAEEAARAAISSPLLDVSIQGAKGVLFSVAGGSDLGMLEIQDAANVVTEAIDPDAKVIFGAVNDDTLKKGEIRVTVIATGFPDTTPGANQSGINSFFGSSAARLSTARAAEVVQKKTEEIEAEQQTTKQPEKIEKKEINNDIAKPVVAKPEPKVVPASEQDDDDWASFPSFLRRK
jgi:cell division protein FtsZ